MTDEQCLRAVVEENCCAAFAALVERYYRQVFAICLRRLHNRADAEDAAQDVFRKLIESSDEIDRDLGGWLRSCAVNTSISMIRSASARRRREALNERANASEEPIERIDRAELVTRMLNELDEQQRELLIRHVVEGVSQSALAEELGVTQQAVASRITTIRLRLRTWMSQRKLASVGLGWLATSWWTSAKAAVCRAAATLGLSGAGGGVGVVTGASAGKSAVVTAAAVGLICLIPGDGPHALPRHANQSHHNRQAGITTNDPDASGYASAVTGSGDGVTASWGYTQNTMRTGSARLSAIAQTSALVPYSPTTTDPLQYNNTPVTSTRTTTVRDATAAPAYPTPPAIPTLINTGNPDQTPSLMTDRHDTLLTTRADQSAKFPTVSTDDEPSVPADPQTDFDRFSPEPVNPNPTTQEPGWPPSHGVIAISVTDAVSNMIPPPWLSKAMAFRLDQADVHRGVGDWRRADGFKEASQTYFNQRLAGWRGFNDELDGRFTDARDRIRENHPIDRSPQYEYPRDVRITDELNGTVVGTLTLHDEADATQPQFVPITRSDHDPQPRHDENVRLDEVMVTQFSTDGPLGHDAHDEVVMPLHLIRPALAFAAMKGDGAELPQEHPQLQQLAGLIAEGLPPVPPDHFIPPVFILAEAHGESGSINSYFNVASLPEPAGLALLGVGSLLLLRRERSTR